MLDSFLRQVTKDSYGPISFPDKTQIPAVIHKFNDAFSTLGWGKMPDPIQNRGRVAAGIFAELNFRYQSPESWKTFLRSPDSLSFRKSGASIAQGGSVSSMLNEISEKLPVQSNFLGIMDEKTFRSLQSGSVLSEAHLTSPAALPMVYPVCEYFPEEKVVSTALMGRTVWDYSGWRTQSAPKMFPFEFLCHFVLTEESLSTLNVDHVAIPKTASLHTLQAGATWDFPLIELVLPQDPLKRRIGLSEALWITGLSASELQQMMLSAAWIAAWTRYQVRESGLNLESIQLKFARTETSSFVLVDAFSLEDLGLEKAGDRFQFETANQFYKKTSWFDAVERAKKQAANLGLSEWKRYCVEPAPWLDSKVKSRIEEEHKVLAQCFLGNSNHVL